MRLKLSTLLLVLIISSIQCFAQTDIETLVNEGIQYHDNGDYIKAIEIYKKALEIDPKSTLVNYEISFSYLKKGDFLEAIKYADVVLEQDEDYILPAYITKGSALDMIGNTNESIKLFEEAIKKTNGHFLLYYNLGIDYYKINELDFAEENIIKAIEMNPNHSSSHLILANINNQKGNSVKTLLASHYFLFLEPNTNRSEQAYALLQNNFGGNVSRDSSKSNTISIALSSNKDKPFGAAELMISMLVASRSLEMNKEKTEDELFIDNTKSLFKLLGELKKENDDDIWWSFYITFFYDLAKSDQMITYCKYITQGRNENSKIWLNENENKLAEFDEWLKIY